jgi:predicted small secreted protein
MIKKLAITLLTIACIAIFCSCNTMHGVGKDVESAGESIQKAAD